MSFHPNDVVRRARAAVVVLIGAFLFLDAAFFNVQVRQNALYALESEQNRLREVPLAAPRGIIYDRRGEVIAENLPGYTVSLLAPSEDSLRSALKRLGGVIEITDDEIDGAARRYRNAPARPTVILPDARFDVISVLEEHRVDFPSLIIQATPKRYYPDSTAVASFVGYTGEVTENELKLPQFEGYKPGQQVGKGGLERYYESRIRGSEGTRFVEVDARGRVVTREGAGRPDLLPEPGQPLYTNIDLDLQRYVAKLFADSALQGGVIALEPKTGAVLAMHSAPSFDPNRFVGGIPAAYWKALNTDPRRPLYNKVIQGIYPPGSTFKLATAALALEQGVISFGDHMPQPCTGGYQYGNRYYRCWYHQGHGSLDLGGAIAKSCDVYFYQLGLKMSLARLVAGGVSLQFNDRSGIDLPAEARPRFPYSLEYFTRRYGPRGWNAGNVLNLAIGQGENAQSVVNMAKFYTALASDGASATPRIARIEPRRVKTLNLNADQFQRLRGALAGVFQEGGTAAASSIKGLVLAGKTGTAQNPPNPDHAWFVGFAPADDPKIVVAVMIEFGGHGSRAAHFASNIIGHFLRVTPVEILQTEG